MLQLKTSLWLKMATKTETNKVDMKPKFVGFFKLFLVLTLKSLIVNYKTANFDAEAENNWCLNYNFGYTVRVNFI